MTREAHTDEALIAEAREHLEWWWEGHDSPPPNNLQSDEHIRRLADRLQALAAPGPNASAVDYVLHYGGRCRDCADEAGVCPMSGLPCDGARKAVEWVVGALEYGIKHEYTTLDALASRLATITPEREALKATIRKASARWMDSRDLGSADEVLNEAADQIIALFNTGKAETP